MTPVIFTPAADDDVTRAAQWYEARREGFGTRLLERVDESVRKIALNPLGYAPVIDDVRRCTLRRFPLALWFRVDAEGSVVIACLHAKRDLVLARERARGVIEIRKPEGPSPG